VVSGLAEVFRSVPKMRFALVVAILALLAAATPVEDKQLAVFAPLTNYTLPVAERAGREYVGLLEVLEPLGHVSSELSGGRWRIRYNNTEGEFQAGQMRARIHGKDVSLTAPFVIENSRGLVPLASLGVLLPRFLGMNVDFHESGRRLLVGNVGIHPSFQVESGQPARLVLNFSGPVNPTIATEPGRVRMVFKRDPLTSPGSQTISFANQSITQANYSESNGQAELDVTTSVPLIAAFSNNGKTITLTAAPIAAKRATAAVSNATNAAQAQNPSAPAGTAAPARPLAVVDAAHGGDERGAALTDQLAEKDVTLGFARLLRHELEQRGFAVLMLRDGDVSIPEDQRASMANGARAAVYVCLHAASQGSGAMVYTSLLPVEGQSAGVFHAWNASQAAVLGNSRAAATAIVQGLQKADFMTRTASASLRPLNHLVMPAVAVELAPGPSGLADLTSANYQQSAAVAIADALASVRDKLGVQP